MIDVGSLKSIYDAVGGGPLSTPDSKAFSLRDYDSMLRRHAEKILSLGDADQMIEFNNVISDLKGFGFKEDELNEVKNQLYTHIAGGIKGISTNNIEERNITEALRVIESQNALAGAKVGVGLIQAITGVNKKNKLVAPKVPREYQKNPILQAELTKAVYSASTPDPEQRRFYESKIAEAQAIADSRAQISGQAGRFVANSQANARNRNNDLLNLRQVENAEQRQDQSRLDSLVSRSISEDQFIQSERRSNFNIENNRFNAAGASAQNQINSGVSNAFAGLNDLANTLPALANGRDRLAEVQNRQIEDENNARGFNDSFSNVTDTPSLNGFSTELSPVPGSTVNRQGTQFTQGEFNLLGGDKFRSDPVIRKRFRDQYGIDDFGQPWSDQDQDIYNKIYNFDSIGSFFQ